MSDRMLPQNVEAEEAVLGSLLIDPEALFRIQSFLRPEHFYIERNRWGYEAIQAIAGRDSEADPVTFLDELEAQGRVEEFGGAARMMQLINVVPSAIRIEHYARIVLDDARRRYLLGMASKLAVAAYDEGQHVNVALGHFQADVTRMLSPETPSDVLAPAVPALPDSVVIDAAMAQGAGAWLDEYIAYAERVAPMTPRLFHESAGLWLASVAIARRLVVPMAFDNIYPAIWVIWVAPTTIWSKTTAMNVARRIALRTMPFLLAPEELTPESMVADMSGIKPMHFDQLPLKLQDEWNLRRNHAGQRGWSVDEFSGLLASAGRDYNAGLLESLLLFYDCADKYSRLTKGTGMQVIRNAYLALLGASTPAALAMHLSADRLWGIGWWPRFAVLTPDAPRPAWAEPQDRVDSMALEVRIRSLYDSLPEATWPNAPVAKTVLLGEHVHDMWMLYNRAMRFELLDENLDTKLWGTYGRMPVHAIKVSTLLAALDWDGDGELRIELTHLSRALQICEGWRVSAHRAIVQVNESAMDRVKTRVLYLISKSQKAGVSMPDLCKAMRSTKPVGIKTTLEELVLSGDVTFVPRVVGPSGGRPSNRYYMTIG